MCLFSLAVRFFFGYGDLVAHWDMWRVLERDWTESRASGIGTRPLKAEPQWRSVGILVSAQTQSSLINLQE